MSLPARIYSAVLALLFAPGVLAQVDPAPPYVERVVDVDGVSLRYLDFGGDGLPVVFTPAPVRDVEGYAEIGARLQDDYRVLAVGHRDETGPMGGYAEDLVGFLDALGIDQAVFAGNTEPAYRMTYLAEEHPERVAGLVYLAGPPSAAAHLFRDPRSGWPMLMRYWGIGDFPEEDSSTYRYREDEDAELSVPALTFVNAAGIRGVEEWVIPLMVAGSPRVADDVADMVRSGDPGGPYLARLLEDEAFHDEELAGIEDAEARAYFQRLAEDEALQAEVERFHDEEVLPVELANWESFKRAFGDRLRVVELDVPVVTGYEYQTAPELIEPHLRRFLDEVQELDEVRAGADPAPPNSGDGWTSAQPLAFTGVTVIDVEDGSALPGMTVVVTGDRITGVSRTGSVSIPSDVRVIDGRGKFLIPGLWDMHAHASRGGRALRFWPLLIAHGVTGVRDTGSYADSLLYWRARSERPGAVAPRIEVTSPSLTGDSPPPLPGMGGPFEIRVADAASAVAVVDSLAGRGVGVVKVYDGLPREAYFAVAERTRERGMSFIGHVPLSVSLVEASDAGQRSFEHVADVWAACAAGGRAALADFAWATARHGPASDSALAARERLVGALAFSAPDPAECGPLLERMEANGTWLTPTLTVLLGELQPRRFDGDARMRWVSNALRERWDARPRMPAEQEAEIGRRMLANAQRAVAVAHAAGVGILAGSDASDMPYIFAGSSLHDELALFVEAGLTPLQALQTATINPARFFGRTDELGTVEEGKLADLVLLDANPLEDIENTQRIRAVVLNGRILDRNALDELLADVERIVGEP